MNAKEFVAKIEQYYGPYPEDFIKGMVFAYVCKQPEDILAELLACLFKGFSSQYGKVPDIAAIEKIKNENGETLRRLGGNYEDENGNIYRGGVRIGHYDRDRFIPFLGDLTHDQIEYYAKHYTALSYASAFEKWKAEIAEGAKMITDGGEA